MLAFTVGRRRIDSIREGLCFDPQRTMAATAGCVLRHDGSAARGWIDQRSVRADNGAFGQMRL
ncbi:hypothetical protein CLF39_27215, partial [Salmonella enterica subsp. enterica serovar Kottbus]|nr:hypothetical protein [Salmonella enterica subsp. enterica serovar Kottbus]